jgi:hypothetical protein
VAELMTDAEEAEIKQARASNGNRPSRSAFQRRADRFTARIYELKTENSELRRENRELRGGLERALVLIDRFRATRRVNGNG